jgi:hypothetical protein
MGNDVTGAFRTHQGYLQAFAHLATAGEWRMEHAQASVADRVRTDGPKIMGAIADRAAIRKSLENAWSTELLLLMSHRLLRGDEIVRVSNNWNVIQAYYALYHATQALVAARGFDRPESHPKTQRMFADFWRPVSERLAPWSLSYGPQGVMPAAVSADLQLHPWSTVDGSTCWSIAAKALQTTRQDAILEKLAAARGDKRKANRKAWQNAQSARPSHKRRTSEPRFPLPRLSQAEKDAVADTVRPHTVLDYLYRLRIRSNYVDSSMFTDGPETPAAAAEVRVSLVKIVSASLCAAEVVLASAPDGAVVGQWAQRWAGGNIPKGIALGLGQRMNQLGA